MLSTQQSHHKVTPTPSAGRSKKRFGVVIALVAMLLFAYLTIAILRSALQSPTQNEPLTNEAEQQN